MAFDINSITKVLLEIWKFYYGIIHSILGTDETISQIIGALILIIVLWLMEPWKKDK